MLMYYTFTPVFKLVLPKTGMFYSCKCSQDILMKLLFAWKPASTLNFILLSKINYMLLFKLFAYILIPLI